MTWHDQHVTPSFCSIPPPQSIINPIHFHELVPAFPKPTRALKSEFSLDSCSDPVSQLLANPRSTLITHHTSSSSTTSNTNTITTTHLLPSIPRRHPPSPDPSSTPLLSPTPLNYFPSFPQTASPAVEKNLSLGNLYPPFVIYFCTSIILANKMSDTAAPELGGVADFGYSSSRLGL